MALAAFPYAERPLNFGHRGASAVAPENTLAAFRKAREMGADGVELDVMLCADGEVVVRHDYTLERTTNGHGRVLDLTLAQVKELDAGSWFGAEFAGEPVPTLREVAEWTADRSFTSRQTRMLLNIELKSVSVAGSALEERVIGIVREYRLADLVVLSSFNPFALWRVRRLAPELHTGLLYAGDLPIYLRRAWLRPLARPAALHPKHDIVTDPCLRWARRKGYRVNVWTVDDVADLQRLIAQRVDMVITNRPDVLTVALAQQRLR